MSEGQTLAVEGPDNCADLEMNPPFTVFLSAVVWENCGPLLADEYPKLMIHYTHPNQSRLAVEVLDD